MQIPKVIALIDWLHLLTVQIKIAANDKDLSDHNRAGRRALAQLNAVRSSTGQDGVVVVCLDQPPYWRKKLYPEYKGKRAEREPEFASILEWTLEAIREDRFPIACAAGEEADDVMATLARIYSQEYGCKDVRIVGADKDGLQCVSDSVRLFVPKERGEFDIRGPEWLMEKFNVKPSDFSLLLAIMGDDSDNIGGIDGLGKGHGAKLINTYKNPEGMAKGLVAAQEAAQKPGAKPLADVWKKFAAGMTKLPFWWKLTTLNQNVQLEMHPLKYLEPIEAPALTGYYTDSSGNIRHPSDFDDDASDFDPPSLEELEEERAVMAASLPVDPAPKPEPRIGKDPNADQILRDQQLNREAMMRENERNVAEARDRHGVERPKAPHAQPVAESGPPAAADAGSQKAGDDPMKHVPPEAQKDIRALGERLGKEAAAKAAAGAEASASSPAPSAAGTTASASAAQVVPHTRGPRRPKVADAIDQNELAVRVESPSWELAAQPGTAKELLQIAEVVFQSPMFRAFGTPQGTFAIMAYGRELGFGYMKSLMAFCAPNGKPFMWAHWMRGMILAHPDCEFFVNIECTQESSTWITRRKSWPKDVPTAKYQFTYAEAVEIGLTEGPNKHNWKTNKRSMVDKTASTRLGRQVWADVIGGLHAPEEEH